MPYPHKRFLIVLVKKRRSAFNRLLNRAAVVPPNLTLQIHQKNIQYIPHGQAMASFRRSSSRSTRADGFAGFNDEVEQFAIALRVGWYYCVCLCAPMHRKISGEFCTKNACSFPQGQQLSQICDIIPHSDSCISVMQEIGLSNGMLGCSINPTLSKVLLL